MVLEGERQRESERERERARGGGERLCMQGMYLKKKKRGCFDGGTREWLPNAVVLDEKYNTFKIRSMLFSLFSLFLCLKI